MAAGGQHQGNDLAPVFALRIMTVCPWLMWSSGPGSAERQAEALRLEDVEVRSDSMGEFHVDFSRYGWFPKHLPSEEGDGESEDNEESE